MRGAVSRVAIWHPGEMGAAVGRVLRGQHVDVVTCVEGRSAGTRERAAREGFLLAPSLAASVTESDLVVSLVWPRAALATAERFAEACRASGGRPVYLDANATSPETKREIAARVAAAGCVCLDGALTSRSTQITTGGRFVLSGAVDDRLLELLRAFDVVVVGDAVGDAAAVNMCRGLFVKGLTALFLDALGAAASRGVHAELVDLLAHRYPSTMEAIRRALPSYPRHLSRRLEELDEVRESRSVAGLPTDLLAGVVAALSRLERAGLDAERYWTFEDLVAELAARSAPRA
jgi:3-hydroxyisobutyrate dehydrogenase-like beta-hydroxyacid dehydrogenase